MGTPTLDELKTQHPDVYSGAVERKIEQTGHRAYDLAVMLDTAAEAAKKEQLDRKSETVAIIVSPAIGFEMVLTAAAAGKRGGASDESIKDSIKKGIMLVIAGQLAPWDDVPVIVDPRAHEVNVGIVSRKDGQPINL